MKHYLILATVLLLVSSCGLYGKFETPQQDLDGVCATVEVTDEVAEVPSWNEVFDDPYLGSLIDSVIARNTDLKIAKLRTDQARAALQTYKVSYIPSLNASLSKSLTTSSPLAANITSSANIDLFGKIRNNILENQESVNLSLINENSVMADLVSSVITNYGTVLMLEDQLKITQEDLARWNKNLEILESMKESGKISESAYLEAKADCQALQGGIIPFFGKIAVYESILSRLLADKPGHIERGTLSDLHVNDLFPDGVPISLLSARPDVQRAERQLAKAFYATNAARGNFYPSLYLSAGLGWSNKDLGTIIDPKAWIFSALSSLTQPIFSHRNLVARLKIAKAEQEAAKLTFTQTLLNAGSDVYLYCMALMGAEMIKDSNVEIVKTLESALCEIEKGLESGNVNYLELLTTQKSLYEAKMALSESYYDIIKWAVQFYLSLGGGYQN